MLMFEPVLRNAICRPSTIHGGTHVAHHRHAQASRRRPPGRQERRRHHLRSRDRADERGSSARAEFREDQYLDQSAGQGSTPPAQRRVGPDRERGHGLGPAAHARGGTAGRRLTVTQPRSQHGSGVFSISPKKKKLPTPGVSLL